MRKHQWKAPALSIYELVQSSIRHEERHRHKEELLRGQEMWPNSEEPIEFENAFFRGKVLFLLKTKHDSAKWQQLLGRNRLLWVQMQGQFKKKPSSLVYIGAELPNIINLGWITSAIAQVIFGVLNALVGGVHYSLGNIISNDSSQRSKNELPHICFPLYSSVDEFICTPPGQEPPQLGQDSFGECSSELAIRKSGLHQYPFNTEDIYTFSFYTGFLDLENWLLVNVPGVPSMNLETFLGMMPMRIVAYSVDSKEDVFENSHDTHTVKDKQYYFNIELSPSELCDESPIQPARGQVKGETIAPPVEYAPVI
jgi:hypothetical protein